MPNSPEINSYLEKETRMTEKIKLPEFREYLELNEIADQLVELTGGWNPVEIYGSGNSSEQKEKFLEAYKEGKEYVPVFTYPRAVEIYEELGDKFKKTKESVNELLSMVKNIKPQSRGERIARIALYSKIKDDLATTKMIEGIATRNDHLTREGMYQKYTHLDETVIDLAKKELANMIEGKKNTTTPLLDKEEIKYLKDLKNKIPCEEIKIAFEWALENLGILYSESNQDGFRVVIDENTKSIDVRDKSKQGRVVVVPSGRSVTRQSLMKLINHEIVGHARQSYNSEKLFRVGGGKLKFDDEVMYEGLALRNEKDMLLELFGEVSEDALPYYVLAIELAEKGSSFHKIFDEVVDLRLHVKLKVPQNETIDRNSINSDELEKVYNSSWSTVIRVMRGHSDMSNKEAFAMSKDIAYLAGYQIDKELVQLESEKLFKDQEMSTGALNEMAGLVKGGLLLLAEFDLSTQTIEELTQQGKYIPSQNLAKKFWYEVLKPEFER